MKPLFLLLAILPALAVILVRPPGGSPVASLQTLMAVDCPEGTIWDEKEMICSPTGPRGSHGGAEDGA